MQRIKPDVDVVKDVLEAVLRLWPEDKFTNSLLQQYTERGGLSRKQLEGLLAKAKKAGAVNEAKAATLEAIILRKPQRYRSALPATAPLYEKNEEAGKLLEQVLSALPEHKRALFLKSKYDTNQVLVAAEINELKKFVAILDKNKNK